MFGERFVVEYSNGKKEAVRPEEFIAWICSCPTSADDPTVNDAKGDIPEQKQPITMVTTKEKKQKKPDAFVNERIKWIEGEHTVYGTVMSIAQLKGKGGKLFLVKWDTRARVGVRTDSR
jgi:hypothetical protein